MYTEKEQLTELSQDLWWSWQEDGQVFWSDLVGLDIWRQYRQSPSQALACLSDGAIEEGIDRIGPARINEFYQRRLNYLNRIDPWFIKQGQPYEGTLAYFCAEFGLHESFPNYSGGLGILAGDHLKSASDLGLPLVAVGLLYREGYGRQQVDQGGSQITTNLPLDFEHLPVQEVFVDDEPAMVSVPMLDQKCYVKIWSLKVGRVSLFLLDTDVDQNPDHLRGITRRLYGGNNETRIRQELILGIGGVRALSLLGIEPNTFHLNEGHSSFLVLERARVYMHKLDVDVYTAIERLRSEHAFTTHTPVEAGHDRFDNDLALSYLSWWARSVGISDGELLALGQWPNRHEYQGMFNMTLLAMRCSDRLNGVAALHGEVSREMFAPYWPDLDTQEVPITHVTNGVHAPTWQHPELRQMLKSNLGEDYLERPASDQVWSQVSGIDDATMWGYRKTARKELVEFALRRENARRERLSLEPFNSKLDPDALTIGFARRFATYKRGDLLFRDMDRLAAILDKAPGPVQFLFSGKAHPADEHGQRVLNNVYQASQHPALAGRLLLVEDYDFEAGRTLVQGADVWLNNPRRPKEASGTSGMKVAMNGGLNFSILDGWWPEGFNGENGWAIGDTRRYESQQAQDDFDLNSLYSILENEVIPTFFDRDEKGLPKAWLAMMKNAISSCTPQFHSDRQVIDYCYNIYSRS